LKWRVVAVVWGAIRLKPNESNVVYKGARDAELLFESARSARALIIETISNIFASKLLKGCALEKVCRRTIAASVREQRSS